MIRKLKKQFVFLMMTVLTIFLVASLGILYYTTSKSFREQSLTALRSALQTEMGMNDAPPAGQPPENAPNRQPGSDADSQPQTPPDTDMTESEASTAQKPDTPPNSNGSDNTPAAPPSQNDPVPDNQPAPARREEVPTTVVEISPDGTASIVSSHLLNLSEEDACAIAAELSANHQVSGVLTNEHLRYLSDIQNPGGTVRYAFADIFQEQTALRTLFIHWGIFGIIAFFVFLAVSILLSIWLTRPVKTAWDKQQQFVADASHELKTPLTVILSNADMILKQPQLLDPKNLQRTHYIQEEARRMKDLVEDLLTLARNDSGHCRAVMETIDLSFLVQERVLAYEPVVFDMGKQLESQITESLSILGDRKELEQLVTILLDNACKYSRPGGLIQVTLNQIDQKHIRLSVMDEGTPLSPEEQKHLFDRFYRADQSRTDTSGYGLGLAIAKSIADSHGWKIRCWSDGVAKNCFEVICPL